MKSLLLLLLLPLGLLSQELAGVWSGVLHTRGNELHYELVISEDGNKLSGYSLTIFTINGVENVGVKSVILKKKKGDLYVEDDKMVYENYTTPPRRVKMFANLSVITKDSVMTLSGKFRTRLIYNYAAENSYYSGTLTLTKQNNFEDSRLSFQLDRLGLMSNLSFMRQTILEKPVTTTVRMENIQPSLPGTNEKIAAPQIINEVTPFAVTERKTEIIRDITFRSDSLVFSLYDNGTVDGDTVSLLLNGTIVLAKKQLSTNALRVVVKMTADMGDSILLAMHAENLGSIPPNTGLLIIQDGNERSEIRFEGNLQKNSGIMLRRKL